MTISKYIGCIMIVVGTTVGAGMLALPLSAAATGFTFSALLIVFLWFLTVLTGLMIIEVNLAFPVHACGFSSMARQLLGLPGRIITWLAYLLLMYAAVGAYIIGASSLITSTLEGVFNIIISNWVSVLIFTFGLGSAVYWSTRSVDYINRGLLSIKGVVLILTLGLIIPHIHHSFVTPEVTKQSLSHLGFAAPIFLCALCYHIVIPSLRIYIGDKPRELTWIIIIGSGIALIIYLFWLAAVFGVIPQTGIHSFNSLAHNNGSVAELVKTISVNTSNRWVSIFINGFADIALTTSFLGVSLGLFDFLADAFKRANTRGGRLQTAVFTFIPPLVFAFAYPQGFLLALNYAGIFVAIMSLILPALMLFKLRKQAVFQSPYRTFNGNLSIIIAFIVGVIIAIIPML